MNPIIQADMVSHIGAVNIGAGYSPLTRTALFPEQKGCSGPSHSRVRLIATEAVRRCTGCWNVHCAGYATAQARFPPVTEVAGFHPGFSMKRAHVPAIAK
jgi:hypothetical protein